MRKALREAKAQVKAAEKAVSVATFALDDAIDTVKIARLAGMRVQNIIDLYDDRWACKAPLNEQARFAWCFIASVLWEHQNSGREAASETAIKMASRLFVLVPRDEIAEMVMERPRLSKWEIGNRLALSVEDWERLGLWQIKPAGTNEEWHRAYRRKKDAERKRSCPARKGDPEKKAAKAAKRAAISEYAKLTGLTEKSIKNKLALGKLVLRAGRDKNVRPTLFIYSADKTVPTEAKGQRAPKPASGPKAPSVRVSLPGWQPVAPPTLNVDWDWLMMRKQREKIGAAIHRRLE